MKIIDKPDYSTWKHEFTCATCSSKLCADHTDLKYRTEQMFSNSAYGDGDGCYYTADRYYVVCPVCNKETQIIPNAHGVNMIYLLQEKIKEEYNESIKKNKH